MTDDPVWDALQECRLRCGYIINFCKTTEEMQAEAEDMRAKVENAIEYMLSTTRTRSLTVKATGS